MKIFTKTLFTLLVTLIFSVTYADNNKSVVRFVPKQFIKINGSQKEEIKDKPGIKDEKKDEVTDIKVEESEQKSETLTNQKEEKILITKNLNSILIESYKAKFSKILGDLNTNIKDKENEEKIKIFSTVLVSITGKINLISSDKVELSDNRKEILTAVLGYIKQDVEGRIQSLIKEK